MNTRHVCVKLAAAAAIGMMLATVAASAAPAPKVDIHGFMLNRVYVTPGATHFEVERIGLQVDAQLTDDAKALVEWYYHYWAPSNRLWLESAYVDFNDKWGGRLRAGRGRNYAFGITPTYGNRKTTEYGLVSETFTMDRITGIQYHKPEPNGWAWDLAVFNGYSLGSRPTMDLHAFDHRANLHLTDRENVAKDVLEVSGRVVKQVSPDLQVGFSARGGKLSPTDVTFLQDNFNSTWTSRTKLRYGPDASYRKAPWLAKGELYLARTGNLDHVGYAVLVGYEPKNPAAAKAYVRYGVSDLDLSAASVDAAQVENHLTMDHQQWMLSVVQPIRPGLWLQFEYIINQEDALVPGVTVPRNDIGFVELFAGF